MKVKHRAAAATGIIFSAVGMIFLALEYTLYQYVDENGFLIESLFLPFGWILIFGGLIIILVVRR